ncbi:MAG: TPM domain-containing protein [Betaproteobacteria bacterium]|nr:TPM domain-containing protein [Betaproteobacteria bacterium]
MRLFVLLAAWSVFTVHAAEGDLQPIPPLKERITDTTATLSAADEARIEAKLKQFEAQKGAQIAVLIVGTTQPEAIFDYAIRVGEAWKLGRKGVDDGVLFLIAKNDRKLQILTGPGVQGVLTDAMSKRIIAEIVAPKFRAGDFAGGIEQGVDKIIGVLQGEALPPPQKKRVAVKNTNYEGFLIVGIIAALVVGPLLRSLLGRFLGASATAGVTGAAAWWIAGGLLFPIVAAVIVFFIVLMMGAMNFLNSGRGGSWSGGGWSTGGSSGGSWSGGSSDSFSGGGGSFDGGGASGDW